MQHMHVENGYFGIFILFIFTFSIFYLITFVARIIGRAMSKKDSEKLKLSIYECGPEVTKQPNKISTQFYIFALLFLLFDVEVIFMFPWAVNFKALGVFGFVEILIFIVLIGIGFAYAWSKGVLKWQSIK